MEWRSSLDMILNSPYWIYARYIVILAIFLSLSWFAGSFLNRLKSKFSSIKKYILVSLCEALTKPIRIFFIVMAFSTIADILGDQLFSEEMVSFIIKKIRLMTVIGLFCWSVLSWKKLYDKIRLANNLMSREEEIKAGVLNKALIVFVILTALLTALDIFEVSLSALLAIGGAGGIAAGFAAKDIVANFFGGFFILVMRPFNIGDMIKTPDGKIDGVVSDIGWYMTVINTYDKHPVYIPNSLISTAILINPSRMKARRILFTVGLRYDDIELVKPIVADIKAMLKKETDLNATFPKRAHFFSYGASTLDIRVDCFSNNVDRTPFLDHQESIMLKAADIVKAHGAGFAFPTTTLDIPPGTLSEK
jgi:MscS family membrane protein